MEVKDIKRAVLNGLSASYKGYTYTVNACRLYKDVNKLKYAIELLDTNKNSIVCADLKDVELCRGLQERNEYE